MKKRAFAVFLCLFLLWTGVPALAAVPQVDPEQRVYDFSGTLSQEELLSLSETAREYSRSQGVDFVAVITDDAMGNSPTVYAGEFYIQNGFGTDSDYSGMNLYLNLADRDIHIYTEGLCQKYFYDSDVDQLLDLTADAIARGEKDGYSGIYHGVSAYLDGARQHVQAVSSGSASPFDEAGPPSNYYDSPLRVRYGVGGIALVSILIGLAAGAIVVGIMVLMHRGSMPAPPTANVYMAQNGMNLTRRRDTFLHTHTSRTAIPKNNSSGGGSGGSRSSGGSTTYRSSGGRSGGGGGRKF